MCDPLSIGLAAGSMLLSTAGSQYTARETAKNQNRAIEAKGDAMRANFNEQDRNRVAAQALLDTATKRFEGPEQTVGLAAAQARRSDAAAGNAPDLSQYQAPTTGNAPSVVQTEIARKIGDALREGRSSAQRSARLSGYGDQAFGNEMSLFNSRGEIAQQGDYAAGTARLLPIQISSAMQNSQKKIGPLGDILKLGGQALGAYGAAGAPGLGGGMMSGAGVGTSAGSGATFTPGTVPAANVPGQSFSMYSPNYASSGWNSSAQLGRVY